ncbi:MAG: bifunctional nuclease family protein [Planctomycetota bacterium]|jgi:bifunctional DNase/RNase
MDRMIEAELARIIINDAVDQQQIWIREKGGGREFPIVIGVTEALAIDRFVKELGTPRPMTHELLHSILTALGAKIARVEVTQLKDSTFHANLALVSADGREMDVDARTSDAIALAVKTGAPLFVHEDVLDEAARDVG